MIEEQIESNKLAGKGQFYDERFDAFGALKRGISESHQFSQSKSGQVPNAANTKPVPLVLSESTKALLSITDCY